MPKWLNTAVEDGMQSSHASKNMVRWCRAMNQLQTSKVKSIIMVVFLIFAQHVLWILVGCSRELWEELEWPGGKAWGNTKIHNPLWNVSSLH